MERDFGKELDELKNEVKRLGELLDGKAAAGKPQDGVERVGHIQRIPNMHPDPRLSSLRGDLESKSGARRTGGAITYLGVFASGGRQSSWIRNGVETDGLLALIENGTAERVLACIGSGERLRLLLAILQKPQTVAELVKTCGFGSTGQVYHHMKPLLAADLIREDMPKGTYVLQPHKVQGLLMLLAGICDMVDETYTCAPPHSEPESEAAPESGD